MDSSLDTRIISAIIVPLCPALTYLLSTWAFMILHIRLFGQVLYTVPYFKYQSGQGRSEPHNFLLWPTMNKGTLSHKTKKPINKCNNDNTHRTIINIFPCPNSFVFNQLILEISIAYLTRPLVQSKLTLLGTHLIEWTGGWLHLSARIMTT